mgnify:CR=1 FL=1
MTFEKYFLSVNGNLFVPTDLVETLKVVCLPVFFVPNYPPEKMSWSTVEEYAPMIYIQKKAEVNHAIYNWLINNNHETAWFLEAFYNRD